MLARTSPAPADAGPRWDERSGRWVRWSGLRWGRAAYSADPAALRDPRPLAEGEALSDERRERVLGDAVAEELMQGAVVLMRQRLAVILEHRRPVRDRTYAVLTLLTLGAAAPVWAGAHVMRRRDRMRLDVDPQGHVWVTEPSR